MQARSKDVELSGYKFRVRKLPPEVGSFIFMRMMGVSMRMRSEGEPQAKATEPVEPSTEVQATITGEMRVRAITFSVFTSGMSFEDFKFVQNACMRSVAIVESRADNDFPMPIVNDAGDWTPNGACVAESVALVMKLTTEVLVFCFSDFFEESSHGS